MKKLVFLGACLVALASAPAMAQTGGRDVVVVRVNDAPGKGRLLVVRPGDKVEEISLNGGGNATSMKESGIAIQHLVTKLHEEGYVLKSTFAGGEGSMATLIFMKEK